MLARLAYLFAAAAGPIHREHDLEDRSPRLAVELDNAAMVAHDLGDERQAEPAAIRFRRNEGIEELGTQVLWDSLAVILHAHDERKLCACLAARHCQTDTMLVSAR